MNDSRSNTAGTRPASGRHGGGSYTVSSRGERQRKRLDLRTPEMHSLLRLDLGWTVERCEEWLAESMERMLLV